MTAVLPLRFRRLSGGDLTFAHEAGGYFLANDQFLERLTSSQLSSRDEEYLDQRGMVLREEGDLSEIGFLHQLAQRSARPAPLSYVLLVPTLRCDLACTYCQVSRAAKQADGFDWSPDTLASVLNFLDEHGGEEIQIEFQGGEPTLRLDLIEAVIDFCRNRFRNSKFVLCTNLSELSEPLRQIISQNDVHISTSLDGSIDLHQKLRTKDVERTNRFLSNLEAAMELASGRIAALPTLDPRDLPAAEALLDIYDRFDMRSIYLRPIVYQGFARKQHPQSRSFDAAWRHFYEAVVAEMIRRNADGPEHYFEEYYLTLAMRRLLQPGYDGHIDLRSPNWLGYDHLVIDFDGQIYPTDEARMLARTGQIDLSIGSVKSGIDNDKRHELQGRAFNALDPWCSQCVYQAACGSDPIDDLARMGRADVPRPQTAFCQRHMHIFDFAIELLSTSDEDVQRSIALWLGLPGPVQLVERYDCA